MTSDCKDMGIIKSEFNYDKASIPLFLGLCQLTEWTTGPPLSKGSRMGRVQGIQ